MAAKKRAGAVSTRQQGNNDRRALRCPRVPKKRALPKDFESKLFKLNLKALIQILEDVDVDARGGSDKQTPLMMRGCTPELAHRLLENGANVNAKDTYGRTALLDSVRTRLRPSLPPQVLIELDADVQANDDNGNTPLHFAAAANNDASLVVFLASGAKVDAINHAKRTPLEFALEQTSKADLEDAALVAEALLNAGAKTTRCQAAGQEAAKTFAKTLQGRLNERCERLVPSSGPAATVQTEVISIAMWVHDELHRNGGVNWDAEDTKMLHAWAQHVSADIDKRISEAEAQEMLKVSVDWVRKNPVPIPLKKPGYER
jgi:hypothetical protein